MRDSVGDPSVPLFITEGARKADSAVSRGLCCVALLGVWGWRGRNADGGRIALPDWEAVALDGRDVYLVFDSDVMTNEDVHAALARLKAFLEHRGAHVRLIYLSPGPNGSKVGLDDFLATGRTVDDLLTLACEQLRASPPSAPPPYEVQEGRICRARQTREGVVVEPLCNFNAMVTEETILDDGAELVRAFTVEGRLDTGEPLPAIRVPALKFTAMNWVTESWGVRAVVHAGQGVRDYLRDAIQRLSPPAPQRRVFTHTGWREVDGRWVYLTAGGAVGHEGCEVDLGPELARYRLPRTPDDAKTAMALSLRFVDIAPLSVTVPLWAAVYRAPLASALPLDFSLWLEGMTGSLKSTVAALALGHFGDFDRKHLPGAWSSTANQLERRAFLLKDTLFVVDDYAPSGLDSRDMETKAARLLRSQGNLAGRGRLRADLTERPAFPPRGLILATGEQHPPGQSIVARTLLIALERSMINLVRLTEMQAEAARFPHAMGGYILSLSPRMAGLSTELRRRFDQLRATATAEGEHLRVPEIVAHLQLGFDVGLEYAAEVGACSPPEAKQLRARAWDALLAVGRTQGRFVEDERPTRRFLRVLQTLLTQGRAVLLPKGAWAEEAGHGDGDHRREVLGWQDGEALYLMPEAAYLAVTRFCRDTGEPFATRDERLRADLAREGLAECDPDRHTKTVKIGKKTRRLLVLRRPAVESVLGEELAKEPATREPDEPEGQDID